MPGPPHAPSPLRRHDVPQVHVRLQPGHGALEDVDIGHCLASALRIARMFVFQICARAADTALCLKAKGPFSKIISTCKKDCKPVLDDDDDDTLGHINGCAANTAVKRRSRTRNYIPWSSLQ